MRWVIAGGTGFIGKSLIREFCRQGDEVLLLSRHPLDPKILQKGCSYQIWDGQHIGPWAQGLEGADAILNLCGDSIADHRWTKERKEELLESRVLPIKVLIEASSLLKNPPKTFLSVSAIGFYGDCPALCVETYPQGDSFLSQVCGAWENAASQAEDQGMRVLIPRLGNVLGHGGMLSKMVPFFQWGLGAIPGQGHQPFPWIHEEDVAKAFRFLILHEEASGSYNLVAPEQVSMKTFCKELGRVLHRPVWMEMPEALLKLVLGERSELLTQGARVSSQKLEQLGYRFQYPELKRALNQIFVTQD